VVDHGLGARMKQYEQPTQMLLPRRTYTVLRLDGKSFHTFTAGCDKPYDESLADALDNAALALLAEGMGGRLGYGQSDEYSFLLTDFDAPNTEAWFGGNVQKIVSVAASVFTAEFNWAYGGVTQGYFDARVFTLPSREEALNYFIWRQIDCVRNSVSMLASCCISHQELMGKTVEQRKTMLEERGQYWDNWPTPYKHGRVVRRTPTQKTVTWRHKRTSEVHEQTVEALAWSVDYHVPLFVPNRTYLEVLIPEVPA